MSMSQEIHDTDRQILAIGFHAADIELLIGNNTGWRAVADPDFRLAWRGEGQYCAALIAQGHNELLSHSQMRYLSHVARQIPLITFIPDGNYIPGRRLDRASSALMFSSTASLLTEICELAREDCWILPGKMDSVFLLLGDSAEGMAARLSDREWYLLHEIQDGKSNGEIARDVGSSEAEVKAWLVDVFGVLGVATRTQAAIVSFFIERHLRDAPGGGVRIACEDGE
ncbi:LuxR C-terminal-related transcriptional regulator [Thalassospira sp. TSL5-1]|uniref:helix-turn-helix transcriptional regulator n=1 Tax=Thalassospira sp. TSL5-1 TaxID=1544451 RepID=UPI00093DE77B|nr:LuxR C-terminal-related transcriptional regulator [Thalassospira sp. TSL5-1]OKH88624.1 hypothetical protein LF95_00450 [Thalassospira sp. TSL5-1]